MKQRQSPSLNPRQVFLEWYHATKMGQLLRTMEASYLQSSLKLTYNQRTLQVGRLGSESQYIPQEYLSRFALICNDPDESSNRSYLIRSANDELPIATGSIDNLILPHIIEFEGNRHQLLREAERVLKPEGHLLILGFNRWSLHGISHYLPLGASFLPSGLVGADRLLDWLALLKFEAEVTAAFSARADGEILHIDSLIGKYRAKVALAYALKGIKRRYNIIPLEPVWIPSAGLVTGHMFETPLA